MGDMIGSAEPSPFGPTIETIECPTCGLKHLAGRGARFESMPTITIDGMVFAELKDRARRVVIMQFLSRDKTLRDLKCDLAKAKAELSDERGLTARLRGKLDMVTAQRNLYRLLVHNLDPHYEDDDDE